MQTFLPFESFSESAKVLDSRRLNKQCVECIQILAIICRKRGWMPIEYKEGKPRKGFWNHPAVRMWEATPWPLLKYFEACVFEAKHRKIETTTYWLYVHKYADLISRNQSYSRHSSAQYNAHLYHVPWLGDAEFHEAHQSNLVRKDPVHYKFDVPNNLPYKWPV